MMKRIGSESADLATALGRDHDRIVVPKTVNPGGCAAPNPLSGLSGDTALAQIEAALKRLEDGEFGLCVSCGGQISLSRLEADPSVIDCGDCGAAPRLGA